MMNAERIRAAENTEANRQERRSKRRSAVRRRMTVTACMLIGLGLLLILGGAGAADGGAGLPWWQWLCGFPAMLAGIVMGYAAEK